MKARGRVEPKGTARASSSETPGVGSRFTYGLCDARVPEAARAYVVNLWGESSPISAYCLRPASAVEEARACVRARARPRQRWVVETPYSGRRSRRAPVTKAGDERKSCGQARSAASSHRLSALWPASVISPSAVIQSRTRSARTSPSASLGPGPSPWTASALVPGSTRQRRESSAASARPWSAAGGSSGCGPACRSGSSPAGRPRAERSAGAGPCSRASPAPNGALPMASPCSRSHRPDSSIHRLARSASALAARAISSTSISERRSSARLTSSASTRATCATPTRRPESR